MGSCFTEHIGAKLAEHKFQVLNNPFGIVYNPISMAQGLERLVAGDQAFTQEALFENAGLWHSWLHHGRFSQPDPEAALAGINQAYQEAVSFLKQTKVLLLTFGTADVFLRTENGQIVANNHKMPAAGFTTRRLSVEEIVTNTLRALQQVKAQNPELQVVLTVSPVRHLRGGLVENQRSKATLVLACAEICVQMPEVHYFPAYELVLDDLRDYRFYAADMLHPSAVAIDYVWQFFVETYLSEKTKQLNARIAKIRAAAQHRPFHAQTPEHQAFVRAQRAAIEALQQEIPDLDFSVEQELLGA